MLLNTQLCWVGLSYAQLDFSISNFYLLQNMLSSALQLSRVLSELRVSVPRLPARSPALAAVSHLRTGPGPTTSRFKLAQDEELPSGQSIVKPDSEARNEILSKINSVLDHGPGRLFAVVNVRGFQHKVTDGNYLKITIKYLTLFSQEIYLWSNQILGLRLVRK